MPVSTTNTTGQAITPPLRYDWTEEALLESVRARILSVDASTYGLKFEPYEVSIEYDDLPPNLVGHKYVCIVPMGITPVRTDEENELIDDWYVDFDVIVVMRCQDIPKDRRSRLYFEIVGSLNQYVHVVNSRINNSHTLRALANARLLEMEQASTSSYGFIETPKVQPIGPPVEVSSALFKSSPGRTDVAGISRRLMYRKARRIKVRGAQ